MNGRVERVLWERTKPNQAMLDLLEQKETALLYPLTDSNAVDIKAIENFIIIDSTWQEAQKIVNKSPYLKNAVKVSFGTEKRSTFKLRRNQPDVGLCTIECIIEILKLKGFDGLASMLQLEFNQFNKMVTAER